MLEYGDGSTNNSQQEYRGSESDADSANLYYQVLTLLASWFINSKLFCNYICLQFAYHHEPT
jgi:hypothetical protein